MAQRGDRHAQPRATLEQHRFADRRDIPPRLDDRSEAGACVAPNARGAFLPPPSASNAKFANPCERNTMIDVRTVFASVAPPDGTPEAALFWEGLEAIAKAATTDPNAARWLDEHRPKPRALALRRADSP